MPDTPSPLPKLLLVLSVVTGLVDAISVLGLGKVFTANMTGNVVFLGFAAASTPGFRIAPYLVAIGAFFVGAVVAGRTGRLHVDRPLRRWLTVSALIETGLLWLAAIVAIDFDVPTQAPESHVYAIIALTALAMGYRNATIRQLKIPDLTTTVLTLTVTGLAADSTLSGGANPNRGRRIASVAAIFAGAAIGAVLVSHGGLVAPLCLAGALVMIGTLVFARHPSAAMPLPR
ncbi:YoaK family protein [Sphingomonas naphthae]|uniref:YoaK family protein n=1 Tax=Sphingomonas naphthae TaxID=1813468 RepID=A0ABY7TMH0_9SPHN|nr:YoaK family protein [Sphingomonas naphthae]WCT74420.1 YoaK family protein [Sphingomonas naphthae]